MRREDYERSGLQKAIHVPRKRDFTVVDFESVGMSPVTYSNEDREANGAVVYVKDGDGNLYGAVIESAEHMDAVIKMLMSARNGIWPTA